MNEEVAGGAAVALLGGQTVTPQYVFRPGGVDEVLAKIKELVAQTETDISTPAGRAAIRSLDRRIASTKRALDQMGKTLTDAINAQAAGIHADRRRIIAEMEALQAQTTKELDEWEAADRARCAGHEDAIAHILKLAEIAPANARPLGRLLTVLQNRLGQLDTDDRRDWQEFAKRARDATETTRSRLQSMIHDAQQAIAEEEAAEARAQAEAARVAEEAEKRRIAREAQVAAEAAEQAKREAEARAQAEAVRVAAEVAAREQAMRLEREEAERLAREALERAEIERAEQEALRRLAEERAEAARVKAHGDALARIVSFRNVDVYVTSAGVRAAMDSLTAMCGEREWEEYADRAQEAALESLEALNRRGAEVAAQEARDRQLEEERERQAMSQRMAEQQAAAMRAATEEARVRQHNAAHRRVVHRAAADSLTAAMVGLPTGVTSFGEIAAAVVEAIAAGKVQHLKVEY